MPVTVDVVIPAYNVEEYVREAVMSAVEQTFPHDAVAIIVVDDGSSDDTVAVVTDIAREHGNVTLLRSDHSGSPSMPRNVGFEHGNGDYVFFLDADDALDPRALEGLVDAAESNGSDIVLGKLDGMNDRAVPSSMFSETVLDADLVEQNLFFALGPTKLFRRSLIEQHGLRFPTDIRVGQDQPFVAEAMLLARKVSVLADRSYYYARFAEDRTRHLSQTFETATQIVHRTRRVTDIVVRHTEPGERRAMLLRRPLGLNLPRAFGESLAALDPDEQENAVSSAAELLREHGDPLTLDSLDVRKRIVLALVQVGATAALLELHEQRAAGDRRDLVVRGGDWFVQVPRSVTDAIGDDACRSPRPTTVCSLSRLTVTAETVRITGWAGPLRGAATPTEVHLELRHRTSGQTVAVASTLGREIGNKRTHAIDFSASVRLDALTASGLWDAYVHTITGAATSETTRFGHPRSNVVALREHEAAPALVGFDPEDEGLTIDVGYTVAAPPAELRLAGAAHDVDGLAEVQLMCPPDLAAAIEVRAALTPAGSRAAPLLLPTRPLGPGLLAARLPEPGEQTLRARLSASYGTRDRGLEPEPGLSLPRRGPAVGLRVDHGELLVIGRRRPTTTTWLRTGLTRTRSRLGAARRRARTLARHVTARGRPA